VYSWIDRLLLSNHHFNFTESYLAFQFKVLNAILFIAAFGTLSINILDMSINHNLPTYQLYFNFTYIITMLFLIYKLRLQKSFFDYAKYVLVLFSLINFTFSFVLVTNDEFRIIWFIILLFVAFILGGHRLGVITAFLIIVDINYLFLATSLELDLSHYAISTATIAIIIISFIMNAFVKKFQELADSMIAQQKRLSEFNNVLDQRVEQKTNEVLELNKALNQRAQKAQIGELISIIAHQWKQPLSTISSIVTAKKLAVQRQKKDNYTEEMLLKALQEVEDQTIYMNNTMDEFRTFFSPLRRKRRENLESYISMSIELTFEVMRQQRVKVYKDVHLPTPLNTYGNILIQVLLTLLKNAAEQFQHTKQNREIKVVAYEKNSQSIIEVSDNAGGIPSEVFPNLFKQYYTTKHQSVGTGLGLHMSQQLIESECHGTLTAHNNELGGATFTITLNHEV
jgi:two-component system C4-dicarboxylate transport sensor histidine kinase DctB